MMKLIALGTIVLISLFTSGSATLGLDISIWSAPTKAQWQCLRDEGLSFAIIEIWNGGHKLEQNTAERVRAAWNAGFEHVDLYAFLCPRCGGNADADNVIAQIRKYVDETGLQHGMLWIDVEQCSGCWNTDLKQNLNYVVASVRAAKKYGFHVGVYSSKYSWSETVGNGGDPELTSVDLWYAHWDHWESFEDGGYNFGGWNRGAIKQHYGDTMLCGVDIDKSWYP